MLAWGWRGCKPNYLQSFNQFVLMKTTLFVLFFLFSFCALTCKKELPTVPPSGSDTTSHNWAFQSFMLGGGNSSALNGVAIINDSLAYTVGEIYSNDSTGQSDQLPYNLAKWDGNQWRLLRVTVPFRGVNITPPLYGIFAFSADQIWIVGDVAIYGNESNWTTYDIRLITGDDSLDAIKCWGSSADNMYFVGLGGTLVHYSGNTWQKIETGTALNINDIWGDYNSSLGQYEIFCVASDVLVKAGIRVFKIYNNSVQNINTEGIAAGNLSCVWFKSKSQYYVAGAGIYQTSNLSDSSWRNGQFDITNTTFMA